MGVTTKYICKVLQPVLEQNHCNSSSCRFRVTSKPEAGQKYLCLRQKLKKKKILGLLLYEAWKNFKMSVNGSQVIS